MARGIIIQIQGDGAGAAEALRLIEERMQETAEKGGEMGEQLAAAGEKIRGAFEMVGIGIGLEQAVEGLKEMVKSSMELAVEIGHLSQQTGISTENLSVLKFAASETGVSFEALTKGFSRLAISVYNADNGNKTALRGFEMLGISQKELKEKGNDLYGILGLIADKFKEMPDGIDKVNAVSDIFSKRMGAQLIPLLNEGAAGLDGFKSEAESLGLVLDEAGIKKMEELHQATTKVKGAFTGLGLEITSALEPAITRLAGDMTKMIEAVKTAPGAVAKGVWGNILQQTLGYAGPGFQIQMDAAAELFKAQQALHPADKAGPATKPVGIDPEVAEENAKKAQEAALKAAEFEQQIQRAQDDAAKRELAALEKEQADEQKIAEASSKLAAANVKAKEEIERSGSETSLKLLEAEHSAGIVSDTEYYQKKLQLLQQANAQEQSFLDAKKDRNLEQQADLGTGNDPATDAKRMELQAQLVELQAKMAELADRRKATEAEITAEMQKQQNAEDARIIAEDVEATNKQAEAQRQQANKLAQLTAGTMTKMADQLMEASMGGRKAMRELSQEMIKDLEMMAMKAVEEEALLPLMKMLFGGAVDGGSGGGVGGGGAAGGGGGILGSALGSLGKAISGLFTGGVSSTDSSSLSDFNSALSGFSQFADGGDPPPGSVAMVGEEGPELFMPKGPGTIVPNDVVSSIAKNGGGGGSTPSVTINNVNNSSSPVTMKQAGVSFDSQMKQFVIHTVLEDWNQGGPVSQAMKTG